MKMKYHKMKDLNEHLLRQLESGQQELDALNMKKANLEEVYLYTCLYGYRLRTYLLKT